ncbi:hypothetical protein V8E52_005351 [Russula decolorans]
MQRLNGVPSNPFTCCLIALALPGLLLLLWSVTAVIKAYINGSSPMHCIAGTWLHPLAPFQTGRKQYEKGGMYRPLSPPPQTEPRLHPRTACPRVPTN